MNTQIKHMIVCPHCEKWAEVSDLISWEANQYRAHCTHCGSIFWVDRNDPGITNRKVEINERL